MFGSYISIKLGGKNCMHQIDSPPKVNLVKHYNIEDRFLPVALNLGFPVHLSKELKKHKTKTDAPTPF